MKNIKFLVAMASVITLPVLAGHLTIQNQTNASLSAVCGDHSNLGKSHQIEPGHNSQIEVHGGDHGKTTCQAIDHHGNVVTSRTFDFHHGNETYQWEVNQHH